jgi:hypothetical protein
MNILFRYLFILFILAFGTTRCNNKGNVGPVLPQSFEWNIDNGPIQAAETISFVPFANYKYIYATKATTDIFLATSSTLTGSYSLTVANATMSLTISGKQYSNLSCDITITSNSNSRLKGTFSGTFGLVNVDTVSVTGTFEDVLYN